jgi:hypothetical protein
MSDQGCPIKDVRSRMSDQGCPIKDVRSRMSDQGCPFTDSLYCTDNRDLIVWGVYRKIVDPTNYFL